MPILLLLHLRQVKAILIRAIGLTIQTWWGFYWLKTKLTKKIFFLFSLIPHLNTRAYYTPGFPSCVRKDKSSRHDFCSPSFGGIGFSLNLECSRKTHVLIVLPQYSVTGESFKRWEGVEGLKKSCQILVKCVPEEDEWPSLFFLWFCLHVSCLGFLPAPCHCHLTFPPRPCDHGQESETEMESSFAL